MVGEQEEFHFTEEDMSSNRAGQQSRGVEQRCETWWADMAISLALGELLSRAPSAGCDWTEG